MRVLATITTFMVLCGTAWAADGGAVYEKKCKACHSIAGAGGPMAKAGGPLDGVGTKRDQAWLHEYLKDPKSKMPNAKMPKLSLAGDEFDAVVGYLLSLKK
jgi:mono/diheme cytochrome c family protein